MIKVLEDLYRKMQLLRKIWIPRHILVFIQGQEMKNDHNKLREEGDRILKWVYWRKYGNPYFHPTVTEEVQTIQIYIGAGPGISHQCDKNLLYVQVVATWYSYRGEISNNMNSRKQMKIIVKTKRDNGIHIQKINLLISLKA